MQKLDQNIYPHKSQIVQDAYDALVASIFISHKDGNPPKLVCVTSALPQAGKTTIAINLSLSLALAGWRVCLLDADIRKTSAAKRLSSATLKGLSDYLDGLCGYEDVMTATNYDNLYMIPCGDVTNKNPLGLLYSPRFDELLRRLRADFDFVLFDTSSLDTNADASVIASKSDGTLLVSAMKTSRRALQRAMDRLGEMNVPVLGNILNKVPKAEYKDAVGSYDYLTTLRKKG